MPNRQLAKDELLLANEILAELRVRIRSLAAGDEALAWALRRKISKELTYDERGKPMQRRILKLKLRVRQANRCAICGTNLPERGAVLDRIEAMAGYTEANTRLVCAACDASVQEDRGYA